MLQHIRPALVLIVLFSVLTGLVYPLAVTGHRADRPARSGQRKPDPEGWRRRRLGADRAMVQERPLFPSASLRHQRHRPNDSTKTIDAPYNADELVGLEPWADLAKAGRPGQGRRRGWRSDGRPRPGSRRRRHDIGLRARSRCLARDRPGPGRRGGEGARLARGSRCGRWLKARSTVGLLGLIGEPRVNVLRLNLALDGLKAS